MNYNWNSENESERNDVVINIIASRKSSLPEPPKYKQIVHTVTYWVGLVMVQPFAASCYHWSIVVSVEADISFHRCTSVHRLTRPVTCTSSASDKWSWSHVAAFRWRRRSAWSPRCRQPILTHHQLSNLDKQSCPCCNGLLARITVPSATRNWTVNATAGTICSVQLKLTLVWLSENFTRFHFSRLQNENRPLQL